ncbi:MAG: fimbrillin family protein [Rikenellaceae bacterium]
MKNLFIYSLGALLAFTACTKEDSLTPSSTNQVTFTSSISSATTKVTDTDFDSGDAISVYAKSGETLVAENVKYEYASSLFSSQSPIVPTGDALSFVAVYPYSTETALTQSFTVATDQSTEASYEASDLLSAVTEATTSTCPELTFYHSLSAIQLNITTLQTISEATINAIATASCNFETGEFTANGNIESITPLSKSEELHLAIVSPQTIEAGSKLIELTIEGTTYELTVNSSIELKSGYKYNCDVTVSGDNVYFDGQIVPWEDGEEIDIVADEKGAEIESVTIASNVYKSLLVDVKVRAGFEGTYAIVPVTASYLESYNGDYDAYAQSFITTDITYYGTDYTVADNMYIFEGDVEGFNIFNAWNPTAGTQYHILAFGAGADGILNTEVAVSEAVTVAEVVNADNVIFPNTAFGSIDIKSIESNSFVYDIIPSDSEMPYIAFTGLKSDYDSAATAEERFTADMIYLDSYLSYYYSSSLAEGGLSKILNTGSIIDRTASSLSSETEYVIYAYGVDATTIQPLSTIEAQEVTTEAYAESTGSINSVTIKDIQMTDATASVDAGDYEGIYYIYALLTSQITNNYGGSAEAAILQYLYVETLIGTDLSTANNKKTFQGDVDFALSTSWTIAPDSEYTVIVAGITPTGALETEIITTTFNSGTLPDDFNITLNMSDITETGATVTTTLSHEGISYMTEFLESSVGADMTDEEVTTYFENLYGGWISYALYTQSGDQDLSGYFKPGRNYTIFSYSYYANAGRLSDVFRIEFTTAGEYVEDSEAPATFETSRQNAPWLNYNSRAVAEAMLSTSSPVANIQNTVSQEKEANALVQVITTSISSETVLQTSDKSVKIPQ